MRRLSTGIEGLDEMLGGGIPEGHIVCVLGTYGTGKTTLALQFTYAGLVNDEKCIFISFESDERELVLSGKNYGMDLERYLKKSLMVVKLSPTSFKASIERIESELPALIRAFGAQRIVVDSITLFEMLFEDDAARRSALFKFCATLKELGVTAVLTAEADKDNPSVSRYGLVEYAADGVILLRYIRSNAMTPTTLAIEVVKMRNTWHSREVKPYDITSEGIKVHTGTEVF
ncbi:MAG TPA: KaiC domain-containing protein [Methanomicrobia archaeon]|nr:RecA-superfamily ATPase [Candidatus Alkanophaga volatiphilum]HDO64397.1 KaiC domain-containing protein [Methanomicrobia archaeon]HEX59990.1 KaiC domain-containing protein [Methanomicrobia archaeon]